MTDIRKPEAEVKCSDYLKKRSWENAKNVTIYGDTFLY